MRFKAVLTSGGIKSISSFVNTLARFGKNVHMVVGEQEVHLLMTTDHTGNDGLFVCARLGKEVVFDSQPSNFICQSKHMNLIAFQYELKLFERVLHGAFTNQADCLEMKLALRRVAGGNAENATRPFLTFTSKGSDLNMVQDLPVSKPYSSTEVDALVRIIRSESVCPFYVDLIKVIEKLSHSLATLKKLSNTIQVSLVKNGDTHFQAFHHINSNTIGVEYRNLDVYPETEKVPDQDIFSSQQCNPTDRLERAMERDAEQSLVVSSRQLARIVSVCMLTKPTKLLCGIHSDLLHMLFVYDTTDLFVSVKLASRSQ